MALQLWLPLDGDYCNYGLTKTNFTHTGSTAAKYSYGKVTDCAYDFSGTCCNTVVNAIYDTCNCSFDYCCNFSYSFWIKNSTANCGSSYVFTVGRANATPYGYGVYDTCNTTNCDRCLGFWFGNKYYYVPYSNDVWTHFAVVVDENSCSKIYCNGVLKRSVGAPSTLPDWSCCNNYTGIGIGIFRYYGGNIYQFHGCLNDFRIYDHVLSCREIKELSFGLSRHYKMSRGGDNLAIPTCYSTYNSSVIQRDISNTLTTVGADKYCICTLQCCGTWGSGIKLASCFCVPYGESYTTSFGILNQNTAIKVCYDYNNYMSGCSGNNNDDCRTTGCVLCSCLCYGIKCFKIGSSNCSSSNTCKCPMYVYDAITVYNCDCYHIWHLLNVKSEYGKIATPWIPNRYSIFYDCYGYSNVTLPNLMCSKTSCYMVDTSSGYKFWTICPSAGGCWTCGKRYHIRANVGVCGGSYTCVTLLFYNLSTCCSAGSVSAPIINGIIDTSLAPTAAVPHLLAYDGISGSTCGNCICFTNMKVTSGDYAEEDTSGYGYNAIADCVSHTSYTPRYLGSTSFCGNGWICGIPDPIKSTTTEFTIAMWFCSSCISCTQALWNGRSTVGGPFSIFLLSSGIRVDDSNLTSVCSGSLSSDCWYHVAVTWKCDGNKITYLNGKAVSSVSAGTISSKSNCYASIGFSSYADNIPSGNNLYGRISDVRVYSTQLAAEDVYNLYADAVSRDNCGNVFVREYVEQGV